MGCRTLAARFGVLSGALLFIAMTSFAIPASAGASPPVTIVNVGIAPQLNQWTQAMSSLYNYQFNTLPDTGGQSTVLDEFAQGTANVGIADLTYDDGLGVTPPPPGSYAYVPIAPQALCLMYNLQSNIGTQVTTLSLDVKTLMGIFTGTILNWSDPRIAALNPGIAFPNTPIDKVFRTDPSAENYLLSSYFSTLRPAAWNAFTTAMGTPPGPQPIYPEPSDHMGGPHGKYDITNFIGQAGSDIAAQYVANNPRSITYLETAYAIEHNLPCASIENERGTFTQPAGNAIAAAMKNVQLNSDSSPDLRSIFESTRTNAYPMSFYVFALTRTSGVPKDLGRELGRFFKYAVCWGQGNPEGLGYGILTPNLLTDVFADIRQINGALDPGPLTAANCPDLNLSGTSGTS